HRIGPDTSKVWNLSVTWMPTSYVNTDVTISWDPSDLGLSEYNYVVLFDVSDSSVVADMLVDTQYIIPDAAPYAPINFQIMCSLNEAPVFSNENPSDGSVDVPVTTSQLTVTIRDPEGDSFNWSIETIPDIGSSSGVGESNGTKICSVGGLSYSTTYTWYVNVTDSGSGTTREEVYTFTTEPQPNNPPNTPTITGPTHGYTHYDYTFTANTTDPENDQIYYMFNWGDGNFSQWLGPYDSGTETPATYNWTDPGTYNIKVKAKDTFD
ncbi:unnamed protein product, partial [marine sediment metagenome]